MTDELRSDAELIRSSLEDPDGFGEIFARHFEAIFRFAVRRVGMDDAADVASDVFVRAYRIRKRYDDSRPDCLPWLYGIATNVLGDRARKLRRRPDILVHIDVTGEFDDADDRLMAQSVADELNAALGRLSSRDRDTFLLFALEGLTYSEIGAALGVPTGTVGSRIKRARHQLREQISALEQITDQMEKGKGSAADG